MVKTRWLTFLSLKTALQHFPLLPHALLIRSSQRWTCTQSSMVKLIIILLWKIRKSFRSKDQIPWNYTWQLLVNACGGGASVWKSLPFGLLTSLQRRAKKKEKNDCNTYKAETNGKATWWIFLRLKNSHEVRHITHTILHTILWVWICFYTLVRRKPVVLSRMCQSCF